MKKLIILILALVMTSCVLVIPEEYRYHHPVENSVWLEREGQSTIRFNKNTFEWAVDGEIIRGEYVYSLYNNRLDWVRLRWTDYTDVYSIDPHILGQTGLGFTVWRHYYEFDRIK